MATNKIQIAEQISRLYTRFHGDRENIKPVLDKREVILLAEQSINKLLNVRSMQGFKEGVVDVPMQSIYTYTNVSVSTDSVGAYVTLPAAPIMLPNSVGIWSICPTGSLTPYIPLPKQYASLFGDTLISALEQKTGWHEHGKVVRFTNDITAAAYGSISGVDIELLSSDLSQLSDTELLPLNKDLENAVVVDVLQTLGMGQTAMNELKAELTNGNSN